MSSSLVSKFALRSLGRNIRRTMLSVAGVGIGCMVALFLTAFVRGSNELRIRSIADSGFGHARIAPPTWEKERDNDLRLKNSAADLAVLRDTKGVKVAAPHARITALLAFGTRVIGVEMLGVEPQMEALLNRVVLTVSEGRYLRPDDRDAVVIGSVIADRLEVAIDDDLFLTVVDHAGQMQYAMVRIVGIAHTGSKELDAGICHISLGDVERLTGYTGAAEISITFEDPLGIDRMVAQIGPALPTGDVILPWNEVLRAQGGDAASDQAFMRLLSIIVVVVVILGITSAQLTAMLERRREFAVLMALGMKDLQVIRLVTVEALVLGLMGALAGLLLATPLVYYTATNGIDFSAMVEGDFAIEGVLFDPILYADIGYWMVPHALIIALVSTFIAALYPAWFAIRTDPTSALSLREA